VAILETVGAWGKGIARNGQAMKLSLVAALMGTMLSACATFPSGGVTAESPPEVKQKAVIERAKARWKAVMDNNVPSAYGFLSSGSKAAGSQDVYGGRARLKGFKSVDVISAACEAETCKVRVDVVLEHRLMKSIPMEIEESWVLEKGQYWYVWRP